MIEQSGHETHTKRTRNAHETHQHHVPPAEGVLQLSLPDAGHGQARVVRKLVTLLLAGHANGIQHVLLVSNMVWDGMVQVS